LPYLAGLSAEAYTLINFQEHGLVLAFDSYYNNFVTDLILIINKKKSFDLLKKIGEKNKL